MAHFSFLTLVFVSMWPPRATDSGIMPLEEWKVFLANESTVDLEVSIEAHTRTYLRSIGPFTKEQFQKATGGAPVHCIHGACTIAFCWTIPGRKGQCLTTAHLTFSKQCLDDHARARVHEFACPTGTEKTVNVSLAGKEHVLPVIEHIPHALVDALVFQAPVPFSSWSVMPKMHQRSITGWIVAQPGDLVWVVGRVSGLKYAKVASASPGGLIILENLPVQHGDSGAAVCHGQSTTECMLVGMLSSIDPKIEAGYAIPVFTLIQAVESLQTAFKGMPQVARFEDQVREVESLHRQNQQYLRVIAEIKLAVWQAMDGFSREDEPMKSIAQVLQDFAP